MARPKMQSWGALPKIMADSSFLSSRENKIRDKASETSPENLTLFCSYEKDVKRCEVFKVVGDCGSIKSKS